MKPGFGIMDQTFKSLGAQSGIGRVEERLILQNRGATAVLENLDFDLGHFGDLVGGN